MGNEESGTLVNRYWEEINGRNFADQRSTSMSTTSPPNKGSWSSAPNALYEQTQSDWRTMRLAWLDQYDLHISQEPENGYRVWRWLSQESTGPSAFLGRRVVWSERRLWNEPLPTTPGLWPQDS